MSDRLAPGEGEGLDSLPILTTKLYRPPVTEELESRAALLELLDQNRARPLTLISAPAGYGKSTLASMWLEASGYPSAWVALDEGDNDLRAFTSYLVAALLRIFPGAELKTQGLLQAPVLAPAPVLARYLLNDLDQIEEPFILALDDLYMIHEQDIYDFVGEFLRHPARVMHLVLITRRDPPLPLAALRARRQVTEVRARDLRFTAAEAGRLLSKMLQREVAEEEAVAWTERTEGWVTALQLAALSLRHRDQGEGLVAYVPGGSRYLQDYLVAEVLGRLSPGRQGWLLATSLLDRFCASLCEAVCQSETGCQEDGMTGEGFVSWLREENLFLIPLDVQEQWFRYHHLFQQQLQRFLRGRAQPGEVAGIHLRASRWFDDHGLWDEAIRHAMAAEDMTAAVQIVVRHRYELMNTQQWQRLYGWLQLLPADTVKQSPHLMSIRIFLGTHMHSGQYAELDSSVQHAERLLATLPPESEEHGVVQAEIKVNQAVLDLIFGEPSRAIDRARGSLQLVPIQAVFVRTLAQAIIAGGLQMRGEYKLGIDMMEEALADPGLPSNLQANALHYLCFVCFMEGDLNGVLGFGRGCLDIGKALGSPWTISHARQHLGVAHYLRHELEEAELHLRALLKDRATSAPNHLTYGVIALALIYLSQGRRAEVEQVLELAYAQLGEMTDKRSLTVMEAFRVELALRMGDLAEAQRLSAGIDLALSPPSWFFYVPQLTPIKLLLGEGTPEGLARARASLETLDAQMRAIHRKAVRIDVLALLALVCETQGDWRAANATLAEALALAEPGGFIRNFVDLGPSMADLLGRLQRDCRNGQRPSMPYIARILRAFQGQDQNDAATRPPSLGFSLEGRRRGMVEPLTRRELQVLRLLATDLSPQEIAGELTVETSTVRKHIGNIYGKLGVHSRLQAVYRAQELELL